MSAPLWHNPSMDLADVILLAVSLLLSGSGGALLVLIAPGWRMDRHREYTSMSWSSSEVLGEDRTGLYSGCMSSFPASFDKFASSIRDKTWLPLLVLGIGLTMPLWKTWGQPEWLALDDDIPMWLHAITNSRFWLAVVAAIIGAVLGGVHKERKG